MRPTAPGRLHAQSLDAPRFDDLADVVRHLCAAQSQLPDLALWGLARRMVGTTLGELQGAVDGAEVLRTHVLRPTWHFVAPDDIHWLLRLTGPRVRRLVETTNRSIGLSPDVVERGTAIVVEALVDGRPRTRAEIATALGEAGLALTGQAVAHVMMNAEIEALVVNGPMEGRQQTYRLLEASPSAADHSRDDLLARIARRYARGHGPIRDTDLAWWTSLTVTDSRRAVDLGGLRPVEVDGTTCWTLDEPVVSEPPAVMLLPNFDEYISYAREPDDLAGIRTATEDVMRAGGLLFVHGRLSGAWTRTVTARRVDIEVRPTVRVTEGLRRGMRAEAEAFGRFVGRDADLRVAD